MPFQGVYSSHSLGCGLDDGKIQMLPNDNVSVRNTLFRALCGLDESNHDLWSRNVEAALQTQGYCRIRCHQWLLMLLAIISRKTMS